MGKERQHEQHAPISLGSDWADEEINGAEMPDARLKARLGRFIKDSWDISSSIPITSGSWADIKVCYRILPNPRVSDQEIISGHLQTTRRRIQATQGLILVLHDTTSFTFERLYPEDLGFLGRLMPGYCEEGEETERPENRICELLMHASLAVSQDGGALGLCALKIWSRKESGKACKDPDDRESRRWIEGLEQSMALLDEPAHCVHVADRGSDIYELFCTAETRAHTFWCGIAQIGWSAMAARVSRTHDAGDAAQGPAPGVFLGSLGVCTHDPDGTAPSTDPGAAPQKGKEQGIAGLAIDGSIRPGKAPPAEPKALIVEADHEPADRIESVPRLDGTKGGRPPYPTETMVRILVLKRLYNLSDEQMEYQLLDRMSYKRFCGLDNALRVPESTLQSPEDPHDHLIRSPLGRIETS